MKKLPIAAALALLALPSALLAQASPSPFTSGTRYDAVGHVTGTISADPDTVGSGNPFLAVRNTYDAAGRLTKVETGTLSGWQSDTVAPTSWTGFTVLRTADATYDVMSRKTLETIREGAAGTVRSATQYSYDSFGRLECTAVRMNPAIYGSLPASACTLGTAGSDGADRITRTVYDLAGQRLQLREGVGTADEGTEATWLYDANGHVTTVIDGNGNRADLRYDGHGRQDRWTFPSTTRPTSFNDSTPATALATAGSVNTNDWEGYAYDPNGNRSDMRKRDGRVLIFDYDALNRVTRKRAWQLGVGVTAETDYTYDLRSLQTSATFGVSGPGIISAYNGFGRLISSTSTMGGISRTLSYQYDANGNRTRITHPDGEPFPYEYDGLNRLTVVYWQTNWLDSFNYDAQGLPTARTERYSSSVAYSHDPIGRLTSIADVYYGGTGSVSTGFSYNPAGQLAGTTRDNDAYAWSGHYAVNRGYTTNGLNQYTAAGVSFGYDANGNLTSDGSNAYVYDAENRLVSASGAHNAALAYDPLGRLWQVTATATGAVTQFLYDGDALIAEYNSAGTMTKRYVHGGDAGADDPLLSWDGPIGPTVRWFHADRQGSIIAVTAVGTGANPSINTYDEYGIPGAANQGRFQYTGQAWLPELGMYYYKARIYSPTLGRFMQIGPIGYEDQFNLYGYVGDDPVNGADPSGTQGIPIPIPRLPLFIPVPGALPPGFRPPDREQIMRDIRTLTDAVNGMFGNWTPAIETITAPILQNRAEETASGGQGCIYCVDGTRTPSGREYVGRAGNIEDRAQSARDGRDRRGAAQVGSYPREDLQAGRNAEQTEMNNRGGVENLDNRRNEVAPRHWESRGIPPPSRDEPDD